LVSKLELLRDIAKASTEIVASRRLKLADMAIGLRYAIAILEGREGEAAGLCYVDYLDTLFEPPVPELHEISLDRLLLSEHHLWRVAGLAIANAAFQYVLWNEKDAYRRYEVYLGRRESWAKLLDLLRGKTPILVIGNMGPLIRFLNENGLQTIALERSPLMRIRSLPDTSLPFVAVKAQSLVVTGASIPNATLSTVLSTVAHAKPKILIGPTAQLDPELARTFGVDAIASTIVKNISRALDIVKRGGGRHDLTEALSDYIIILSYHK